MREVVTRTFSLFAAEGLIQVIGRTQAHSRNYPPAQPRL
jgi:hypothetical protein